MGLLALLGNASCALDESDLLAFRTTATGPEKLRAVLRDGTRPSSLRASAALNLLDLERRDVNGREALFRDLKALSARGRNEIVPSFKTGLSARMRTPPNTEPSDSALRAKDAGVELLPMLGQRERELLGAELLGWMLADLPLRADAGLYNLEQVAERVGPGSAPTLVAALEPTVPPRDLERLLNIVLKHADASARAACAERIVQVERAHREPRHRRVIEEQLRREGAFAPTTEGSLIEAQVDARRDEALQKRLLPALGRLADQPAARARLLQIAQAPDYPAVERTLAFSLLQGRIAAVDLPALVELALDNKQPDELREVAIERAGETRSRELLPTLLILVSERTRASLRQRAGELLLEIGGPQSLQAFLRALPRAWDQAYAKAEIDAYSQRITQWSADRYLFNFLGAKLHSVYWWNRVLALRYFAVRGVAEDAWRIRQHLSDQQPVRGPGWPADYTVGHEAEGALAIALERFRKPASAE